MKLTGVILAGGKSRRMGQDKALLQYGRENLLEQMVSLLEEFCESIVILSADPAHSHAKAIRVEDPRQGPLVALSQLKVQTPALVLAVDMPGVDFALLQKLIQVNEDEHVVLVDQNAVRQPFPAIYPASAFSLARELVREGKRSMQDLLNQLNPLVIPPQHSEQLLNINTPEEWQQIKK